MSRADREATVWLDKMKGRDAEQHRADFAAWLALPGNQAAYDRNARAWEQAGGVSRARIDALVAAQAQSQGGRRWAFGTILAAALALGFAWYITGTKDEPQLAADSTSAPATMLTDGTHVVLMDGARLETQFTATARRVLLTGGRAQFNVAHDSKRPFTVVAGGSETTALGTIFEVDLRRAAPRISLIEGSVEVRAAGRAERLVLRPGEKADVRAAGPALVSRESDPGIAGSATLLKADEMPLAAIVEQANRVNAVPIRLADPALGALQVTGRFDLQDSASLARKLAAALDLSADIGADGATLRQAPTQ